MIHFKKSVAFVAGCLVFAASFSCPAVAQHRHSQITPYITDDVVAVLYVDLEAIDIDGALETANQLGFIQADQAKRIADVVPMVKSKIESLTQAGIKIVYFPIGIAVLQNEGISCVVPLAEGVDRLAAKNTFAGLADDFIRQEQKTLGLAFRSGATAKIATTESALLVASSETHLQKLKTEKANSRRLGDELWQSLGNGAIGFVIFGDADSRKVVRELMPALPPPFEAITAELVANKLKWFSAELKIAKPPSLNIQIEMADEETAATIKDAIATGFKLVEEFPATEAFLPKTEHPFFFSGIAPTRNGTRVSISSEELTKDMDRLGRAVDLLLSQERDSDRSRVLDNLVFPDFRFNIGIAAGLSGRTAVDPNEPENSLKQLALAMHNYESAFGHLPAQCSVNADGKPLLSWRVQILPFLEQEELYKKFKLDEPWDSLHNAKLIEKMPGIYWGSGSDADQNNRRGKTVFQVPAGKRLVFDQGAKTKFDELKDGSSDTVMVATVARRNAVIWTKPTDWQVDLADPTQMLRQRERTQASVAKCDGTIVSLDLKADKQQWQNIIQPADGNAVEFDR